MIDLTGIASAIIAGVFTIAAVVVPLIIQSHMKDKQAAAVVSNAVVNALGAIKQATIEGKLPPIIPGVPPRLAEGVRYVNDHAGAEADRIGLTPELIADKISAKAGLQALAADVAVASAPPISGPDIATLPTPTMPRPLFRPTA